LALGQSDLDSLRGFAKPILDQPHNKRGMACARPELTPKRRYELRIVQCEGLRHSADISRGAVRDALGSPPWVPALALRPEGSTASPSGAAPACFRSVVFRHEPRTVLRRWRRLRASRRSWHTDWHKLVRAHRAAFLFADFGLGSIRSRDGSASATRALARIGTRNVRLPSLRAWRWPGRISQRTRCRGRPRRSAAVSILTNPVGIGGVGDWGRPFRCPSLVERVRRRGEDHDRRRGEQGLRRPLSRLLIP
jgi:hypothetical protein